MLKYFSNVVKNLNLRVDESLPNQNLNFIKRYENNPGIKGTERNVERRNLTFSIATFAYIDQKLKKDTDIPTWILKENSDLFAQFNYINLS